MLQSRQLIVDGSAIFIEEARDRFQFAGTKSRENSGGGATDASKDRPHFPSGAFAGNDQDAAPIVAVALPGDISRAFEPVEKSSDCAGGQSRFRGELSRGEGAASREDIEAAKVASADPQPGRGCLIQAIHVAVNHPQRGEDCFDLPAFPFT